MTRDQPHQSPSTQQIVHSGGGIFFTAKRGRGVRVREGEREGGTWGPRSIEGGEKRGYI